MQKNRLAGCPTGGKPDFIRCYSYFRRDAVVSDGPGFFIPLLIGTGGNAGAQSATLMVRAIATGDITMGQWVRVLSKEMLVGSSLGFTMAGGVWALGLFRGGFEIGLVVGLAMICIVVVANILGAVLPFLLTKLRLDPAVASSPLIASITDAVGLLIYFSIAVRIIGRI